MELLRSAATPAKTRKVRKQKPMISLDIPTPVRQTRPPHGGRGDSPPGSPADTGVVRELLRRYDGGLCGEAFGGDRLLKLSVLGKGSTSTVWEAVDVDTLQVVAIKEMVVCDSKQTAVLEHELRILHSQLQPLPGVSGDGIDQSWGYAGVTNFELRRATSTSSTSSSNNSSSNIGEDRVDRKGRGKGKVSERRQQQRKGEKQAYSPRRRNPDFCPYIPRYFGSFLSESNTDDITRVCIVEEHVLGGDLGRWIDQGALDATVAAVAAAVAAVDSTGVGEKMRNGSGVVTGDASGNGYNGEKRERISWRSISSSSKSAAFLSSAGLHSSSEAVVLPPPPPEAWLARVCRDTLEALRHLHARRCIHRDVKPSNILLDKVSGGAKLADFGSTVGEGDGDAAHRMHGTIRFMSPERLWAKQCSPSSDLWSAGLSVATAALGENPVPHCASEFDALDHAEKAFESVKAHPGAALLSTVLMDFLKDVLVAQPEDRPTVEQMLQHPFVLGADGNSSSGNSGGGASCGVEVGQAYRVGANGVAGCGSNCWGDTDSGLEGGGGRVGREAAEEGRDAGAVVDGGHAYRDPLERLRSKRPAAGAGAAVADRPEEVVRRIVAARGRRRRRSRGSPFCYCGVTDAVDLQSGAAVVAGGRCPQQAPSPLQELDVTHLASVLQVTVAELRSMLSSANAEHEGESAYASDHSIEHSSVSSSVANSLSPALKRAAASGDGGDSVFSSSTGIAAGDDNELPASTVRKTKAKLARPSVLLDKKNTRAKPATPAASCRSERTARTTKRLARWHHRSPHGDDRNCSNSNRNNKNNESSPSSGHGTTPSKNRGSAEGDPRRGRPNRSGSSGSGGSSPGRCNSGKSGAATTGVVGRLWSRVQRGRFKSSRRTRREGKMGTEGGGGGGLCGGDPTGEGSSRGGKSGTGGGDGGGRGRHDLPHLLDTKKQLSFIAKMRPSSGPDGCVGAPGCEGNADAAAAAAAAAAAFAAAVTPDVGRRNELLADAGNGVIGSRGASKCDFSDLVDAEMMGSSPCATEISVSSALMAPGWGAADIFRDGGEQGFPNGDAGTDLRAVEGGGHGGVIVASATGGASTRVDERASGR